MHISSISSYSSGAIHFSSDQNDHRITYNDAILMYAIKLIDKEVKSNNIPINFPHLREVDSFVSTIEDRIQKEAEAHIKMLYNDGLPYDGKQIFKAVDN